MDWEDIYKQRLTTPQEAVKLIKNGDTVMVPIFPPVMPVLALAQRKEDLSDVTIRLLAPAADPGWLRMPDESVFKVEFELFIGDFARFVMDERRGAYLPNLFSLGMKAYDQGRDGVAPPDVMLCTVSKPNRAGFVHFGMHHWVQRSYARRCPKVIAQVDESLVPVYGDVYIHVSEIDAFVEFTPPPLDRARFDQIIATIPDETRRAGWSALADELPSLLVLSSVQGVIPAIAPDDARRLLGLSEPPEEAGPIAKHLHGIIKDGDTIQIGVGEPSRGMVRLGAFKGKKHLGIHTELGWPGIAQMWKDGIVDGSRKEIHTGKSVAAAWTGCDPNDLEIILDNPHFELYDPEYITHLRTLTQLNQFVSINNAITVDLLGQVNAETVFGGRMINGTGGQPELALGGAFSKNGRSITLLPSTAMGGAVSRVVAEMDQGSYITVPRFFADTIITEYGVAELLGRNHRQRAEAMIAIAHPDHRAELTAKAHALWWP